MTLTDAQKTGLEASILAYLAAAAAGGRFVRTAAAFGEEMRGPGSEDVLMVSGDVLVKAWDRYVRAKPQTVGLEAAVVAYLIAGKGRFARTVVAYKEETQVQGVSGSGEAALVRSEDLLETAWLSVYHELRGKLTQKGNMSLQS